MNAIRIRAIKALGKTVSIVASGMPIFVARRRMYAGVVIRKRRTLCAPAMNTMLKMNHRAGLMLDLTVFLTTTLASITRNAGNTLMLTIDNLQSQCCSLPFASS